MGETLIGIKMADQSFYPVMEEGNQGKKRLVLTTVRDNQNTVQIDLYKSIDKTVDPSHYVGSLVIENIEDAPRGEPEIEVILGIDEHKNLNAVARNLRTGMKQRLQTSLENLEEHEIYDIPEFELEEENQMPSRTQAATGSEPAGKSTIAGENYPFNEDDRRKTYLHEKKKSPAGKIILITVGLLLLIGVAALIVYYINNNYRLPLPDFGNLFIFNNNKSAETEPQTTAEVSRTEQLASAAPSEVPTKAPDPTQAPASPAKTEQEKKLTRVVPTNNTVKINGVEYIEYKIVWGDTLWWIANKYYGNPWLYKKIFRYEKNRLKDPDLIIAGTKLYIPKK